MPDRANGHDTVAELRRAARQLMAEAQAGTDLDARRECAEQSFELAQLAEQLERRLAGVVPVIDGADRTNGALLEKARRWRLRAEEYRAVADALQHSHAARHAYLHLAHSYDTLANQTEARALALGARRASGPG